MGRIKIILVDTTVVIDIWRGRSKIKSVLNLFSDRDIYISAITLTEIYDGLGYTKEKKGINIYNQIKKQIDNILSDFHLIPINNIILQDSGIIKGSLRAKGIILDIADCIIGISARFIGAEKLITRNPSHFKEFGVSIEAYEI